jgi:hypothetical protein
LSEGDWSVCFAKDDLQLRSQLLEPIPTALKLDERRSGILPTRFSAELDTRSLCFLNATRFLEGLDVCADTSTQCADS